MRLISNEELSVVGGGSVSINDIYQTVTIIHDDSGNSGRTNGSSSSNEAGGGGGGVDQTAVNDGTAAKAQLAMNDALAKANCSMIGSAVAVTVTILAFETGPLARYIGGAAGALVKAGCNALVDQQKKNDQRENNKE